MTFQRLLQQSLLWRGFYFVTLLVVNVVLSRFLHADGIGWLFYVTNFFSLILLLASLSLESGFTYYSSNKTIGSNKLAWFAVIWTMLVGIIITIAVYFYFTQIRKIARLEVGQFVLYSITYVCGIMLINFFTVLFYAAKNFLLPNLIMGLVHLLIIPVIFILSKAENAYNNIVACFFFSILLQGILLAITFIFKGKAINQFSLPSSIQLKPLFKYSLIALLGNLLFFFMYKIDYWFVRFFCDDIDLGNYIQASKLAQMVLVIPQILASVIFPETASGTNKNEVGKSILILFRVVLQVILVCIIVSILFGQSVFSFVFGTSFNKMNLPFVLLLPGIFSISITVLIAAFFSGHGSVKLNVVGTAIGFLVVLILDCIMVKPFGIIGAAIASSIGYTAFLLYALWHFKKMYPFVMADVFAFNKQDWVWVKNTLLHKK